MPGVAGTDVAQGSVEDKTLDNQWCFLKSERTWLGARLQV